MIRLAVCDPRTKVRQTLRKALGEAAAETGIGAFAIGQFATIDAAVETLAACRRGYCSLLLCGIDGMSPQEAFLLSQFKEQFPRMRLVLFSANPASAITVYRVHAEDFILLASGAGDFARVVGEQLEEIACRRRETITLKTTSGINVLDADTVMFAETSGSGPLIHLANGAELQTRGTLQALYEQMAHDARFTKVGGSFIVNLDNVRSAGKSSLVFPDGSIVIVPIRARKPVQDALAAWRAG